MPERIATILGRTLDWDVRQHFVRAYEAMWRDLDFAIDQRKAPVERAVSSGWTRERLRAICVLSAFARTVLGPLAAAMGRKKGVNLGLTVPIQYGTALTISSQANSDVREALEAFELLCHEIEIPPRWLHLNRLNDILYYINKRSDGEGEDGNG